MAAPTITKIVPDIGYTNQTALGVTITGTDLDGDNPTLEIGGVECTGYSAASATTATATIDLSGYGVPQHGYKDVDLTTDDGEGSLVSGFLVRRRGGATYEKARRRRRGEDDERG